MIHVGTGAGSSGLLRFWPLELIDEKLLLRVEALGPFFVRFDGGVGWHDTQVG